MDTTSFARTVVALQMDIAWEDKPANFARVRGLLEKAAPPRDSLVVLPEMFATGFSMNTGAIAESYGGGTEQFLAATGKQFAVYLLAGAAMRGRDGQARNKALVFSPAGDLLGFSAKMRPFTPGGESEHYTAGERPLVFAWGECRVAPLVCYDLRFPELFRESAAAQQPELFVVIASWPEKRIVHWVRLLQARAIENQAYVVGVNRIGSDPYYHYTGRSVVVDFNGEILADAGATQGAILANLDLAGLRKYREGLPFLADMSKARTRKSGVARKKVG
jgi:omega-amidase